MSQKLILIDGHSLLNRAFYGVPVLTNAKGFPTNAIYGFLNILFRILEDEKADYLTVAFDVSAPTFRHEMYKEYKGTRKPMPEELHKQVPVMKEVLQAMGILIKEQAGLEADDILGTLAKRAEKEGLEVSLVSGDRDLLQIATEHIKIMIPKTKGGKTQVENYYAKDVKEAYGVTPVQFIELKALMGDASDNIPGVPKVGEKTAAKLMGEYGSLEGIYEHLEEISQKAVRESLRKNRSLADLSRDLATIRTECEISFSFEEAKIRDFYTKEAYGLFQELEFKNLLNRFETEQADEKIAGKIRCINELSEAEAAFLQCKKAENTGFFLLEHGTEDFSGIALCYSDNDICVIKEGGFLTRDYLTEKLKDLVGKTCLASFHMKKAYRYLKDFSETDFDILIAAYLLNPLKNDYAIEDVAAEYLGISMTSYARLFGKKSMKEAAMEEASWTEYAGLGAYTVYKSAKVLQERLFKTGMEKLFREVEMPLSYVLYQMETEGVMVRPEELQSYGDALVGRISELEQSIHERAGEEFNVNSPKQLGEVLFEKMKLPGGKKTKTGYSTAADILEKLAAKHPIVAEVLEYRTLSKLKSTYADGLSAFIGEDRRIHSSFNQTITATGRISSTEPNLQNIPMRMELGRRIRKVFVPKEGYVFTDADYSQIELRILAHMSGDEQLIQAYRTDSDIHRITASKVFHVPLSEVTDLQRRNAKAVNFGIVYGISSFGLSQDLSITRKEAADYIDQYFATYPKVKEFLDKSVEEAKKNGYVTTLFGRRRPVPELSSGNFMQRSFGERVAMNSPIQGTAADVMKIAMIRVYRALQERKLKSRLILQVHDELLIETARDEEKIVKALVEKEMKEAADFSVVLEVDVHTGENWYEAK